MSNANYLAHFGTKGQKHGLRRHQSYETAPTRSGMVGQEVGEAARQSERLNRRDEQDDRNGPRRGPMQYEAKPSYNSPSDLAKASKKQTLKEKLRAKKAEKDAQNVEKNKAKWATNYKDLEAHKDAFTNKELEYALNRLNLTNRIKSDRWEQTRNLTQKGADTMKNLANASKSFVDIYNVVAGGYNTYQNYKANKKNKVDLMPKWNASSGQYNINNQNKSNSNNNNNNKGGNKPNFNGNKNLKKKFKHSSMSAKEYIAHFGVPGQKKGIHNFQSYDTAPTRSGMVSEERGLANLSADDYIAHFGIPGQQWFKRHFQSYKTAPTRSGKVGEEIGLAAKQAERLGDEEKPSDKPKNLESHGLKGYERETDKYGGRYRKTLYDKDETKTRITIDDEDDGSLNEKSLNLMKYVEDNWDDVKKSVIDTYIDHLTDDYIYYEDMSREEGKKAAKKALSDPKKTELYIRPIGDWDELDIGLYNPDLLWGDHILNIEYDPYRKKSVSGMSMNG